MAGDPTRFSDWAEKTILAGGELLAGAVAGVSNFVAAVRTIRGQKVSALVSTDGAVTVDVALGKYFTLAPTENIETWVFTNSAGAGYGDSIIIWLTQAPTPVTVNLSQFRQAGGATGVVSSTAGAIDMLAISTSDDWATKYITIGKGYE